LGQSKKQKPKEQSIVAMTRPDEKKEEIAADRFLLIAESGGTIAVRLQGDPAWMASALGIAIMDMQIKIVEGTLQRKLKEQMELIRKAQTGIIPATEMPPKECFRGNPRKRRIVRP